MSEKRKDNKGRILRSGESQRKDLTYQYRYTDPFGRRETVYSPDLKGLREKELEIEKMALKGGDYAAGNITVEELVQRYLGFKKGVRYNTKVGYKFVSNLISKQVFAKKKIRDVKVSDAQLWLLKLQNQDGYGHSSICTVRGVLKPAFQLAVNDDVLPKNPFDFPLVGLIKNDSSTHPVLSVEQEKEWMDFIKNSSTYSKYYDEFVVLLNTGLRVSEFCGLTKTDLDFENRRIRVDHQLLRERNGTYFIEYPKTKAGSRFVPMNDATYQSLQNILKNRPKLEEEMTIDGYTGFILIDSRRHPKVALHLINELRWAQARYNTLYPGNSMPKISPHVFRHTFCTRMATSGMDVKTLQYIMGHSDIGVTMNVYTHCDYDQAAKQMAKIYSYSE